MGRNDDLLTFAQTAEQLKVTRRHLGHMVRRGYIRPAKVGRYRKDSLFRPEDVNAVLAMRGRGVDLPKLARIAAQAHALSLSNAAKLEKICAFLGLENNRLRLDEESVFLLHMKVHETLKLQLSDLHASAVMEWASTFNGFDEAYLHIVEGYTNDQSPWRLYLELANRLMTEQNTKLETNLKFAYSCLDAARRHLRHVSYFYVMNRFGERVANDLFVKGSVDDEIIAQLHPQLELLRH
jgi:hypothetical protein